jgi:hypothetical protein
MIGVSPSSRRLGAESWPPLTPIMYSVAQARSRNKRGIKMRA